MTKYRVITAYSVSGSYGYVIERRGWFFWRTMSHVIPTLQEAITRVESMSKPTGLIVHEEETE